MGEELGGSGRETLIRKYNIKKSIFNKWNKKENKYLFYYRTVASP